MGFNQTGIIRVYIPPPEPELFNPLTGRTLKNGRKAAPVTMDKAARLRYGNACWVAIGESCVTWLAARKWFDSIASPGKYWFILYPVYGDPFIFLAPNRQVSLKCPNGAERNHGNMPSWAGSRRVRLIRQEVESTGRMAAL